MLGPDQCQSKMAPGKGIGVHRNASQLAISWTSPWLCSDYTHLLFTATAFFVSAHSCRACIQLKMDSYLYGDSSGNGNELLVFKQRHWKRSFSTWTWLYFSSFAGLWSTCILGASISRRNEFYVNKKIIESEMTGISNPIWKEMLFYFYDRIFLLGLDYFFFFEIQRIGSYPVQKYDSISTN